MSQRFNLKPNSKISKSLGSTDDIKKQLIEGYQSQQAKIKEKMTMEKRLETKTIIIPESFTQSIHLKEIKFTNFVESTDNDLIKKNIKLLTDNIEGLISKLTFVTDDPKNNRRLSKICDVYGWELKQQAEALNLMKINGQSVGKENKFRVLIGIDNFGQLNEDVIFTFIFIDPHHLAIPSRHNGIPKEEMCRRTYVTCQYYKVPISELFK